MERPLALVVCTDPMVQRMLNHAFSEASIDVVEVGGSIEALDVLRTRPVRIALLDDELPGVSIPDVVDRAARLCPGAVCVALTREHAWERGAALIEQGCFDVLMRPLAADRLQLEVRKLVGQARLLGDVERLRERLRNRAGYHGLVGRSPAMERLRDKLERQASLDAPLLLLGETGTGRELAARTVHSMSARQGQPLLAFDCTTPSEQALAEELFGFERDSSSGSRRRGIGVLESADGGAVLLDEITALPADVQVRLSEALAQRVFVRQGGKTAVPLNVRIFSTSSLNVERATREGRLREDLYRQLAVGIVELPPLRERREDIPLLTQSFVDTICEINDLAPYKAAPEAMNVLEAYSWPGNVRELRDVVEHAVILASGQTIRPTDLPHSIRQAAAEAPSEASADRPFRAAKRELVEAFERGYLRELMALHRGNVTAAAQKAGMLRSALQRLLRKYDIRSADFRGKRPGKSAPTRH